MNTRLLREGYNAAGLRAMKQYGEYPGDPVGWQEARRSEMANAYANMEGASNPSDRAWWRGYYMYFKETAEQAHRIGNRFRTTIPGKGPVDVV